MNVWARLLKMLLGEVGPMLWAIVSSFTTKERMNQVAVLARAWVTRLAGDAGLTGPQKRNAALAGIQDELAAAGIQIGVTLILLLIQAAYAEYLAHQGRTAEEPEAEDPA